MDLHISQKGDEKYFSIVCNNEEKIDWKWLSNCQEMKLVRNSYKVIKEKGEWKTVVRFSVNDIKIGE
jgi:hypothetical protein